MDLLLQVELKNLADLKPAAYQILTEIRKPDRILLLLEGEMGAGKTTFVRALADCLNIKSNVNSPTFNLLNQYSESLYHYDLYRVGEIEAEEAGFFELWGSGSDSFQLHIIEWPQKIPALYLFNHSYVLRFEYSLDEPEEFRKLTLYQCLP